MEETENSNSLSEYWKSVHNLNRMLGGTMEKSQIEEISCKWCGEKTINAGTVECDRCWELRHRIESNLTLAQMMISHFEKK